MYEDKDGRWVYRDGLRSVSCEIVSTARKKKTGGTYGKRPKPLVTPSGCTSVALTPAPLLVSTPATLTISPAPATPLSTLSALSVVQDKLE